MGEEVRLLSNAIPPDRPADVTECSAILEKGRRILHEQKLDITKDWLGLLIGRIDDIQALENFPTQDSIRTSVRLIEGLADALRDESILEQFEEGGQFYEQATTLGLLQRDKSGSIEALSSSLDALEDALWDRLSGGMRQQDREIFRMVRVLRQGLHLIMTAAVEAYHKLWLLLGSNPSRRFLFYPERQLQQPEGGHVPFQKPVPALPAGKRHGCDGAGLRFRV